MSSENQGPIRQNHDQVEMQSEDTAEEHVHMEKVMEPIDDMDPAKLLEELKKWQEIAAEQKEKAEENYNQYLRARADIENLRRRARKDLEQGLKYAVVPFIEALLPVLDNFERALEAADQSENASVLKEGIEMVYRQFLQVLSESGLTLIEAEGKPFDPHMHNAVQQVHSEQTEPGMVVQELQSGYRFHDRVIRPSMVKVSN